ACVNAIAACLFGGSVSRSAVRNADFGYLRMMNAGSTRDVFVEQFGESEVEDFHLAGRRHHHVAGFDVAMNDSAGVSSAEGVRGLQGNRQGAFERQWTAVYQLPHVAPLDVL